MHACIERKRRAIVYPHGGYWLDIGRPDDYAEASEKIGDLLKRILPEPEDPPQP
jgi:NDP-sugar pyrophosphorylase family protein